METNELIKDYLDCKIKMKELKDKKANIKAQIETQMAVEDTDVLQCEAGVAKLNKYMRKALDSTKVKDFCAETGQDVDYFYKETEVTQLKVEGEDVSD